MELFSGCCSSCFLGIFAGSRLGRESRDGLLLNRLSFDLFLDSRFYCIFSSGDKKGGQYTQDHHSSG